MSSRRRQAPLTVGLVGAGTALHAMFGPALKILEAEGSGIRLSCVMDPWDEARGAAAARYGVKAYATLAGMIRHARPDVAIVASPTWAHAEQTERLADAGIHVFCEKPMARTPQECDAMIRACEAAGVALGLGFMKRVNRSFAVVADLLRQDAIGRLYEVDCEWSFPATFGPERYAHPHTDWRGHLENWGGVFQDHGSHTIDLARTWLGEVHQVSAQARILNPEQHVEDVAVVLCRHADGGISAHRRNLRKHKPLRERYELFGAGGTLEIEWGGIWRWSAYTAEPMNVRLFREGREVVDLTPRPEQSIGIELQRHWHYLSELRRFFEAVRAGTAPRPSGADGRAVVEVVTAAYLSAATGQTVQLPLGPPVDLEAIFSSGVFRS